ncbi:MAG: hemagglutinin repeat-containing protein [Pseudomonadota bacterium]
MGSKITAISDNLQIADNTSNERLQGAATLKAGYDAYKFANGGITKGNGDAGAFRTNLTDSKLDANAADPNSGSAFGISVSVGINSSKQDNSSATTTNRGTSIQAKNINITATEGDITAVGAKLQGENISLDAAKDINLMAAVNTSNIKSSNESHSLGGGVTFGVGQQSGISFQFNAGQANGNTNGTEATFDNTLVTATNKLTVKSGGNTNLVGAQLAGNSVKMDVGGDLNVITLQDQSNFNSEQHSSGISLSLCIPPICVGNTVSGSISKSDSTIAHNYISATGQSGIAAGTGGYDINVKGNTDLQGGAITSKASTDQNTLKTGSLTSSDLNNAQNTNSQSSSISLSYSGSSSGLSNLANNVANNALANLGSGNGMPANGSQSGTTQSVISPGTVTITGTGDTAKDANSNAQVATLTTRDAATANGSLTNTLTLQQAQLIPGQMQTAAENTRAANLAGAAMDGMIGDIAQANGWEPGSVPSTILHGISGMAQSAIGGTNTTTGFVSAVVNEQVVQPMANYIAENCTTCVVKNSDGTTQMDVKGNPVLNQTGKDLLVASSTIVGVGTTAALGGTNTDMAAGGSIAKNSTEFNFLKHPELVRLGKIRAKQAAGTCTAECVRDLADLNALSARRNEGYRDTMESATTEQATVRLGQLSSDMNGLASYRNGLAEQLQTTTDPSDRAALQLQINTVDNSVLQIANLGKDYLAMLYQRTGERQYQVAFQTLVAGTNGNDLSGLWGSGTAGPGKQTKKPVDVEPPVSGVPQKPAPEPVDGPAFNAGTPKKNPTDTSSTGAPAPEPSNTSATTSSVTPKPLVPAGSVADNSYGSGSTTYKPATVSSTAGEEFSTNGGNASTAGNLVDGAPSINQLGRPVVASEVFQSFAAPQAQSVVGTATFQAKAVAVAQQSAATGDAGLVTLATAADDIAGGYKTINVTRVTLQDGTTLLVGGQSGPTLLSPATRQFFLDNGIIPLPSGQATFHAEGNTVITVTTSTNATNPVTSIVLAPSKPMCSNCVSNGRLFETDTNIPIILAPGVTESGKGSKGGTGALPWKNYRD